MAEQERVLERFGRVKLGSARPFINDIILQPIAIKENCRNCGAPHDGFKCGYCGTKYSDLKVEERRSVKFYSTGFNFGAL